MEETLAGIVKKLDLHRLGFEKDFMTYDQYEKISQALQEINFIPTAGIVENTRTTKDQNEVGLIKKAAQIGDEAFNYILSRIKVGISEKEIEAELEYQMKRKGAFSTAFPTIVASGPRSSLPHALPTERKLQYGDFVTLDFGASYQNYRSDMTRTIIIGKTDKKQKQIYELVLAAQKQGIQSIKAGILGSEVDRQARTMIAEAGFGDFFGHGLGHGVGLEIHEEPFLNSKSQTILEAGNTITVEPGVYLPHWGGVRIEDTVLVTEDGCQLLTHSPKELITIQ